MPMKSRFSKQERDAGRYRKTAASHCSRKLTEMKIRAADLPISCPQTVDKVSIERSRLFSCHNFWTCRKLSHETGAGAESRGRTLTAEHRTESGRATLDAATRITLDCVSSGNYAAGLPPGEGKAMIRL